MEQGPQLSHEQQGDPAEGQPGRKFPEDLFPKILERGQSEVQADNKSFEQLVHEALEEELRPERDPRLRRKAYERADAILAEFQAAKAAPTTEPTKPEPPKIAPLPQPPSSKSPLSPAPSWPTPRAARGSRFRGLGLVDLILAVAIIVLLIIVILLLIF